MLVLFRIATGAECHVGEDEDISDASADLAGLLDEADEFDRDNESGASDADQLGEDSFVCGSDSCSDTSEDSCSSSSDEDDDPTWCTNDDGHSYRREYEAYEEFVASLNSDPRRSRRKAIKEGCRGHDSAFSCDNCWTGKEWKIM